MTDDPIFIVGSPRSGTTLMRAIINRHPRLSVCDETHYFPLIYHRRRAFGDLADIENRRRVITEFMANRHFKRSNPNTAELFETLMRDGTSYKNLFTAVMQSYADSRGKQRLGEKTPRHALSLTTLREWYPNCVIIHMMRDPRAAVASMLHMPWAQRSVVANARRWATLNEAVLKFRGQPRYIEVRYEALVTDPETEVRRICAVADEEFEPRMVQGEGTFEKGKLNSGRMAISSDRQEAWRRELSKAQVAQIEWALGPQLEKFGYHAAEPPASAFIALRGKCYSAFDMTRAWVVTLPERLYRRWAPTNLTKYQYWQDRTRFGAKKPPSKQHTPVAGSQPR
jgi:hypothetical protein